MDQQATSEGRIPSLHVVADSIPQAYYRAMKAVWEHGMAIRTEYDRKDESGKYIDPAGRDARVLIEVRDPFRQPRYPAVSFCEIGVYIAEIMGLKDYRVLPMEKLKTAIAGDFSSTEWPYTYHQRLFDHPDTDGATVNQIDLMLERLVKTPFSRRAVATTSVPNIDPFLKEDVPCLREIQLRCPEDANGNLVANLSTAWRSRDLYKAWPDNVVAITFLQSWLAKQLEERMGRKVRVGSYADYSFSMHIYGQDVAAIAGDEAQGMQGFFETFDEETFIARSLPSEIAVEMLVLPQLRNLLTDRQREQWQFPPESIEIVERLIEDLEMGRVKA
ncbi:MAG: thymidylate synthase [FCB group bacterium]|jgi:thymidylate synthase|nr:thymidylate synthase [FCB group bacterium]